MYSSLKIKEKLILAQKRIDSTYSKSKRFNIQLYSPAESRKYTQFIESLLDPESTPDKPFLDPTKRPNGFNADEIQFIENEKIVCQSYFLYWATRYAFITNWTGSSLVLFPPNRAQKIVHRIWAELEEQNLAITIMQLKARQLGVSTLTELAIAHRVQFLTRRNALIASSDLDKTRKMGAMMKRAWENQPFWLRLHFIPYESGDRFAYFPETKSSVTSQHGNKVSGIARGDTPTDAHISELPDFDHPEEHIDASLMNAMHENPDMFMVLESTAKGTGDWWHLTWLDAKSGWAKGESDLCPVFLPYFLGDDIYPTATWLRKTLLKSQVSLDTWKPDKKTLAHAKSAQDYVRNTPYLTKELGKNWQLSKEMQWFWEFKYKQAKRKNNLTKFLEELPSNDQEAFQFSGKPILSHELIQILDSNKAPLANYQGKPAVFAIVGDGIPPELEPETKYIDYTRSYITVECNWSYTSPKKLIYRFIPLHHDLALWENRLFIWQFPFTEPDSSYCNGIDCSQGLEQDNTVMIVNRKGSFAKPAMQVAEFASPNIPAMSLFPHAMALGTFYSKVTNEVINQCRQAIEVNFGGNDLQLELMKHGWSNFHEWEGYYDNRSQKPRSGKLGWVTNMATRPILISRSIKAIKDGYWRINSPYLIGELKTLQKEDDMARIEAARGRRDDRFFAGSISFFSAHVRELYMSEIGGWGQLGEGERLGISFNQIIEQKEKQIQEPNYKTTEILINNVLPGGSDYQALLNSKDEEKDIYNHYRGVL